MGKADRYTAWGEADGQREAEKIRQQITGYYDRLYSSIDCQDS